jgi:trans-aconitate methyltransferase
MDDVSWWQEAHQVWTDLVEDLHLLPESPIVDIGAGSSMMVDALLARGFTNLTAVDISTAALERTRQRVGAGVDLVVADVRSYVTDVPVSLWHDRAVFHFLTDPEDRARYRHNLHASLAAEGHAVIATFAPDGPQTCSGLPVQRYSADDLAEELDLPLRTSERRIHVTPAGAEQPFTIAVLGP